MKYSREIQVGIFTVVAGFLLYFGFNFLRGINFFHPTRSYLALYENVGGLTVSNKVLIRGFVVGRVAAIEVSEKYQGKILVEFEVDKKIKITENTVALLADQGMLGGKVINLIVKEGKEIEPLSMLNSQTEESMTDAMKAKAEPLVKSMDSIMNNLNAILKDYRKSSNSVSGIIGNAEQTTGSLNGILAENRTHFAQVTQNMAILSSSLIQTQKELNSMVQKLNTTADSINAIKIATIAGRMNESIENLRQITHSINQAEGTLGLLIKTDSIHRNIDSLTSNLNAVLVDFKQRPKRYLPPVSVLPKKDKKKKKGEKEE